MAVKHESSLEWKAMDFLRTHLPQSDRACYPAEMFLEFVHHALMVREKAPWCGGLDWEIFAHYVLFPRVNDEELSFHRAVFHDALWPRVKDLPTQEERALEVNRWCHEHVSYEAQDDRTASPMTVYRGGRGRCGEESAFLVSALRSVGIPARQVYVPRWSHCGDNHAWVEVLCGERWRYMGACEPEPVLDRGWFTAAASRAMLVHSRIFGEGSSPLHGEPLGRTGAVRWFNQTARYASVKEYTFQALAGGKPAPGAVFRLQVLNEASFHTIAVLAAGEDGTARARLGQGSLHVVATQGGLFAECACGEDGAVLHLETVETGNSDWVDIDFYPPAGDPVPPPPLSGSQKAERKAVLQRGNALRSQWIEGGGNQAEVQAFLQGEYPEERGKFLRTLTEKDLRDGAREVWEDHFRRLPPGKGLPEEIYWRYVACPRIAWEPLAAWRRPLQGWLAVWYGSPEELWTRLGEIFTDPGEDVYDNLHWPPDRVLEARKCDGKGRKAFFVACLRTLGIPARLRFLDGEPEVWRDGGFAPVRAFETGTLRLTGPEVDWTLSRRTARGWKLLRPEGVRELVLPTGDYRVMVAERLPNGSQIASMRDLRLKAGQTWEIELRARAYDWKDALDSRAMPALSAAGLDGQPVPDPLRQDGRPVLALWLEEGGEPTEHLLGELAGYRERLDALPVRVLFLVRGRESLAQRTLARVLDGWDKPEVLVDDWAYDLEAAARCLGHDPECAPLAAACSGGRAVYSTGGYQVGSAELLVRAAEFLCGRA